MQKIGKTILLLAVIICSVKTTEAQEKSELGISLGFRTGSIHSPLSHLTLGNTLLPSAPVINLKRTSKEGRRIQNLTVSFQYESEDLVSINPIQFETFETTLGYDYLFRIRQGFLDGLYLGAGIELLHGLDRTHTDLPESTTNELTLGFSKFATVQAVKYLGKKEKFYLDMKARLGSKKTASASTDSNNFGSSDFCIYSNLEVGIGFRFTK